MGQDHDELVFLLGSLELRLQEVIELSLVHPALRAHGGYRIESDDPDGEVGIWIGDPVAMLVGDILLGEAVSGWARG